MFPLGAYVHFDDIPSSGNISQHVTTTYVNVEEDIVSQWLKCFLQEPLSTLLLFHFH